MRKNQNIAELGPISDAIRKLAAEKRKEKTEYLQFFVVVSDRTEEGTSYIYGPFTTIREQMEFQKSNFPKGCGRLVHLVNSRAFIKPL